MNLTLTPEQQVRYEAFRRWKMAWGGAAGWEAEDIRREKVRQHRSARRWTEDIGAWSAVESALDEALYTPESAIHFYREVVEELHNAIHGATEPERWEWAMQLAENVMQVHPAP